MPEAEVEVEVEEEEDLKQEENVLKEEDYIYQMNLKGGSCPIFTEEQEREVRNMVLANAIRLREIQANIIGEHAIFNNVH